MKRKFFIFAGLLIASVAATGCRNGQKEATQPATQAQPVPALHLSPLNHRFNPILTSVLTQLDIMVRQAALIT